MSQYDSDFDPDELELLMQGGQAPEEIQQLLLQMEMANEMRNRKGAQGRDAGRAYVAANPLEHLADAMTRIKGNKEFDSAKELIPGYMKTQRSAREKYFQGPRQAIMEEQALKATDRNMVSPTLDMNRFTPPEINMPQQDLAAAIRKKAKPRVMSADEFMGLPRKPTFGASGSR